MKKLSTKIIAAVLISVVATLGTFGLFYWLFAEDYYVYLEKVSMEELFREIKQYDFMTEADELDRLIDEHEDIYTRCVIADSNKHLVYYSYKERLAKEDFVAFSNRELKMFENGSEKAQIHKIDDTYSRIELRCVVYQNDRKYYVSMREKLDAVGNAFSYTNAFLFSAIVITVLVTALVIYLVTKRISRSVAGVETVAKRISEGDLSVRYNKAVSKDEIGSLALSVNKMADVIQENINRLSNYNFLLNEDIKRMNEYEEMRKKVVSNITHELKTPLAIISSQIEMLEVTKNEEKKKHYYQSAMEEILKMSRLISDILNVSHFEKQLYSGAPTTVDLTAAANRLFDKWKAMATNKRIVLDSVIESGCVLEIIEEHFDHVFNNYLMNALNHVSPNGMIRVRLKKQADECILSVYNEGNYIKEEDTERIWTQYYTHNSDGNEGESFGLGLFIVKELSFINGTTCGIKNVKNGVEFWFRFRNRSSVDSNG